MGREYPFANTYCHGPKSCTLDDTKTLTVGGHDVEGNLDMKLFEPLNLGISGSLNMDDSTATAETLSKNLKDSECGYFAFAPVIRESCGTLTTSTPFMPDDKAYDGVCSPKTSEWSTKKNYCASQLRRNPDDTVDGETIFVRTNCDTRMPLPDDKQDPTYQKPGVALERSAQQQWANTFGRQADGQGNPQNGEVKTQEAEDKTQEAEDKTQEAEDKTQDGDGDEAGKDQNGEKPENADVKAPDADVKALDAEDKTQDVDGDEAGTNQKGVKPEDGEVMTPDAEDKTQDDDKYAEIKASYDEFKTKYAEIQTQGGDVKTKDSKVKALDDEVRIQDAAVLVRRRGQDQERRGQD